MNTLFPLEPVFPEGFLYVPDFITKEEENYLLEEISKVELHAFHFQGYEAKRRVVSFGYDWRYPIGSVINWHRDAPPFDIIAGISLQSDCTFRLRPHDKTKQSRSSIISIPVRRRSLYVMQGPSRTDWQHSTAAVKEVRYSITLRTLRG